MLCTKSVLYIRNNFCTQYVLPRVELGIFIYWICNSMKNLSSYCGLVDAKIRASDKDLPVPCTFWPSSKVSWFQNVLFEISNSPKIHRKSSWLVSALYYVGRHFYRTKLNFTSKFFTKTGVFRQNKTISCSTLHFDKIFMQ